MFTLEMKTFLEDVAIQVSGNYKILSHLTEEDKNIKDSGMELMGGAFLVMYSLAVTDGHVSNISKSFKSSTVEDCSQEMKEVLTNVAGTCAATLKERLNIGSEGLKGEALGFYNLSLAFMTLYKVYASILLSNPIH